MALIDQAAALQQQSQPAPGGATTPDPNAAPDQGGDDSGSDSGGSPLDAGTIKQMQDQLESKIPAPMKDAFDRVTVAGGKILYSPQTAGMLKQQVAAPGPMDKKLTGATLGLMSLLSSQSKGQIPPAVYIPAGAWLLLDIAGTFVQSGQQVTDQDVRDGLDQFSAAVMAKNGASPQQVTQTVGGQQAPDDGSSDGSAPPDPSAQPGAPQ